MSFESIHRNAGIDPREHMENLSASAKLMEAGAHSRTVPPKDLSRKCATATLF